MLSRPSSPHPAAAGLVQLVLLAYLHQLSVASSTDNSFVDLRSPIDLSPKEVRQKDITLPLEKRRLLVGPPLRPALKDEREEVFPLRELGKSREKLEQERKDREHEMKRIREVEEEKNLEDLRRRRGDRHSSRSSGGTRSALSGRRGPDYTSQTRGRLHEVPRISQSEKESDRQLEIERVREIEEEKKLEFRGQRNGGNRPDTSRRLHLSNPTTYTVELGSRRRIPIVIDSGDYQRGPVTNQFGDDIRTPFSSGRPFVPGGQGPVPEDHRGGGWTSLRPEDHRGPFRRPGGVWMDRRPNRPDGIPYRYPMDSSEGYVGEHHVHHHQFLPGIRIEPVLPVEPVAPIEPVAPVEPVAPAGRPGLVGSSVQGAALTAAAIRDAAVAAQLQQAVLQSHLSQATAVADIKNALIKTKLNQAAANANNALVNTQVANNVQQAAVAQQITHVQNTLKSVLKEKIKQQVGVAAAIAAQGAARKQKAADLAVLISHANNPHNLQLEHHVAEYKHHLRRAREELLLRLALLKPFFKSTQGYSIPSLLPDIPVGVDLTQTKVASLPLVPTKVSQPVVPGHLLPAFLQQYIKPPLDKTFIEYVLALPETVFTSIMHMNKKEFLVTLFPPIFRDVVASHEVPVDAEYATPAPALPTTPSYVYGPPTPLYTPPPPPPPITTLKTPSYVYGPPTPPPTPPPPPPPITTFKTPSYVYGPPPPPPTPPPPPPPLKTPSYVYGLPPPPPTLPPPPPTLPPPPPPTPTLKTPSYVYGPPPTPPPPPPYVPPHVTTLRTPSHSYGPPPTTTTEDSYSFISGQDPHGGGKYYKSADPTHHRAVHGREFKGPPHESFKVIHADEGVDDGVLVDGNVKADDFVISVAQAPDLTADIHHPPKAFHYKIPETKLPLEDTYTGFEPQKFEVPSHQHSFSGSPRTEKLRQEEVVEKHIHHHFHFLPKEEKPEHHYPTTLSPPIVATTHLPSIPTDDGYYVPVIGPAVHTTTPHIPNLPPPYTTTSPGVTTSTVFVPSDGIQVRPLGSSVTSSETTPLPLFPARFPTTLRPSIILEDDEKISDSYSPPTLPPIPPPILPPIPPPILPHIPLPVETTTGRPFTHRPTESSYDHISHSSKPPVSSYKPPSSGGTVITHLKPVLTTTSGPFIPNTGKPVITTTYRPPQKPDYKPVITTTHKPPVVTTTYRPPTTSSFSFTDVIGPVTPTYKPPVVTTTYRPPTTSSFSFTDVIGPVTPTYKPPPVITTTKIPLTTTYRPPLQPTTPRPNLPDFLKPVFTTTYKPPITTTYRPRPDILGPVKPIVTTTYRPPVTTTYKPPRPPTTTYQPLPPPTTTERPTFLEGILPIRPTVTTTYRPPIFPTEVPGQTGRPLPLFPTSDQPPFVSTLPPISTTENPTFVTDSPSTSTPDTVFNLRPSIVDSGLDDDFMTTLRPLLDFENVGVPLPPAVGPNERLRLLVGEEHPELDSIPFTSSNDDDHTFTLFQKRKSKNNTESGTKIRSPHPRSVSPEDFLAAAIPATFNTPKPSSTIPLSSNQQHQQQQQQHIRTQIQQQQELQQRIKQFQEQQQRQQQQGQHHQQHQQSTPPQHQQQLTPPQQQHHQQHQQLPPPQQQHHQQQQQLTPPQGQHPQQHGFSRPQALAHLVKTGQHQQSPIHNRKPPMPHKIDANGLPVTPENAEKVIAELAAKLAKLPPHLREIPPCSHTPGGIRSFCLMPDGYPSDVANKLVRDFGNDIKQLGDILQQIPSPQFDLQAVAEQVPLIDTSVSCETEERTVELSWTRDVLGSWLVVLQTEPLRQAITVTTCSAKAASQGCRPFFLPKPLVAFHPKDPVPRPLLFEFPVPVSCVYATDPTQDAASTTVEVTIDPKNKNETPEDQHRISSAESVQITTTTTTISQGNTSHAKSNTTTISPERNDPHTKTSMEDTSGTHPDRPQEESQLFPSLMLEHSDPEKDLEKIEDLFPMIQDFDEMARPGGVQWSDYEMYSESSPSIRIVYPVVTQNGRIVDEDDIVTLQEKSTTSGQKKHALTFPVVIISHFIILTRVPFFL
ncbi:uncharacterized protein LOC143039337 [Oratosquilla oratoria]|uniref:uncharacterized protein LOC143039337 n=1 Tax=Oratosquilla oratoria TaxID=337810 RepID=UPI003F75E98C